jgi:DnaJ family protein C protein 9
MAHVPHCTTADEPRFIELINEAIRAGDLDEHADWKATSGDQKARKERVKKEKKEAKEAEEAAREMGVWDEFYGDKAGNGSAQSEENTKETKRGTKRKPASTANGGEGEDVSALAALIGKRQQSRASAFDALLDKYSTPQADDDKARGKKGKGSKRGKKAAEDVNAEMPVSGFSALVWDTADGWAQTEEEFQRLQEKMFADKAESGKKGKRGGR